MADPITLTTLLMLGGAAAANALVEELTKDAYGKLKTGLAGVFGRKATDAVKLLEVESTREEGRRELDAMLSDMRPEYAEELAPLAHELHKRLQDDVEARKLAEARNINLDVEAVGDITVRDVDGPDNFNMKGKAGGNLTIEGLKMGSRERTGN